MTILLVVCAAGIVTGLIRGGTIKNLAGVRLRAVPVVFAAVLLQVAGLFTPSWAGIALVLVSYAGVFVFAAANARRAGLALIAAGALMNLAVVAANGGMPVSHESLARARIEDRFAGGATRSGLHVLETAATRLRLLDDRIPLAPFRHVVSPGDLVLWAGLLVFVQGMVAGPRGCRVAGARPHEEPAGTRPST